MSLRRKPTKDKTGKQSNLTNEQLIKQTFDQMMHEMKELNKMQIVCDVEDSHYGVSGSEVEGKFGRYCEYLDKSNVNYIRLYAPLTCIQTNDSKNPPLVKHDMLTSIWNGEEHNQSRIYFGDDWKERFSLIS